MYIRGINVGIGVATTSADLAIRRSKDQWAHLPIGRNDCRTIVAEALATGGGRLLFSIDLKFDRSQEHFHY